MSLQEKSEDYENIGIDNTVVSERIKNVYAMHH